MKLSRESLSAWFKRLYIEELWQAYLGQCCEGCRTGSFDCDVNPIAKRPSREEIVVLLLKYEECP